MSSPIYKCFTKATGRETGAPTRSINWVRAKRGWFKIFEDRIECGNWTIPYDSIKEGVVYKTRSVFIPCTVLAISTSERTYQFGFNPWAKPIEHLPIELREEQVKLGHSPFSLIVRVVALGYILYLILG